MILPGRQPHPVDGALGAPHNRRIGYSKQSHRPRERPIGLHLESHPPAYESPKVTVVTVVTVIHSPRNYPVPISTLGHPRWKVEHVWTHHWDKMCVEAPKMYRNATHKLCFLFQDFETRHCHINMRVSPPKWAHLRIWQIDKIQKTKPWNFVDVPIYIPRYSQTYWWLYRLYLQRNHSTNSEAIFSARLRLCVLTLPRATQGNAPVDEIFTWIRWGRENPAEICSDVEKNVLTIWSCVVNHAEQHG